MGNQKHDWPRLLEEHRKSGDSVKDFCQSRGIHPNTFYKNRKLRDSRPLVEIPVTPTMDVTPIEVNVGRYRVSFKRGFDRESSR